jgi:hypothetical protein
MDVDGVDVDGGGTGVVVINKYWQNVKHRLPEFGSRGGLREFTS